MKKVENVFEVKVEFIEQSPITAPFVPILYVSKHPRLFLLWKPLNVITDNSVNLI